jgi:hypothetical protein
MLLAVLPLSLFAAESKTGTVTEMGWGKFIMEDESGTQQRFHISKRDTAFKPNTWRPQAGDQVNVSFTKIPGRNGIKLKCIQVELVEAGAANQALQSPVMVEMVEISHRKIRAIVSESNMEVQFDRKRGTRMDPAGWVPATGDKALIHFHSVPARFSFGIVHIADKVEQQ